MHRPRHKHAECRLLPRDSTHSCRWRLVARSSSASAPPLTPSWYPRPLNCSSCACDSAACCAPKVPSSAAAAAMPALPAAACSCCCGVGRGRALGRLGPLGRLGGCTCGCCCCREAAGAGAPDCCRCSALARSAASAAARAGSVGCWEGWAVAGAVARFGITSLTLVAGFSAGGSAGAAAGGASLLAAAAARCAWRARMAAWRAGSAAVAPGAAGCAEPPATCGSEGRFRKVLVMLLKVMPSSPATTEQRQKRERERESLTVKATTGRHQRPPAPTRPTPLAPALLPPAAAPCRHQGQVSCSPRRCKR